MRLFDVDDGGVPCEEEASKTERPEEANSTGEENRGKRDRSQKKGEAITGICPKREGSRHIHSGSIRLGAGMCQSNTQASDTESEAQCESLVEEDCEGQGQPAMAKAASGKELMRLLLDQEKRCALSGLELTIDSMELGHITPTCEGGTDSIGNLMWIDSRINRMQGTLSNDEFVKLCRLVSAWNS